MNIREFVCTSDTRWLRQADGRLRTRLYRFANTQRHQWKCEQEVTLEKFHIIRPSAICCLTNFRNSFSVVRVKIQIFISHLDFVCIAGARYSCAGELCDRQWCAVCSKPRNVFVLTMRPTSSYGYRKLRNSVCACCNSRCPFVVHPLLNFLFTALSLKHRQWPKWLMKLLQSDTTADTIMKLNISFNQKINSIKMSLPFVRKSTWLIFHGNLSLSLAYSVCRFHVLHGVRQLSRCKKVKIKWI